jgi:hypothetical protein
MKTPLFKLLEMEIGIVLTNKHIQKTLKTKKIECDMGVQRM